MSVCSASFRCSPLAVALRLARSASKPRTVSRVPSASAQTLRGANFALGASTRPLEGLGSRVPIFSKAPTRTICASVATEAEAAPTPIYLKDYAAPSYLVETLDLDFDLGEETSKCRAVSKIVPNYEGSPPTLELDGDASMVLAGISIDGKEISADKYELKSSGELRILDLPAGSFTLEIVTDLEPQNNTALEGLYKSSGNFCTQCEANGFRRITFFQDRPDVMAKYTTRITADKAKYPVLLSNGNLMDSGDLSDGKHFALWEDPWVKPCYLFALVAGDLALIEDSFTAADGRDIALKIWVEEHNAHKADFAMESLKASMKWDEDVYGLVYDLDLFNIVAVDDFNMGAMENKSLNVFNSRAVLASPDTATDAEYNFIERVVAHEYFHNYTGNRVTCRDWFQLSLKEGLTVFRDQQFSADMNSEGVKRIADVAGLRAGQFPQDSGPMAHPIRPDSYIKMDNFYTVTVYSKGAEVVRMYQTLLGKEGFRKGMDLYFERHDGQAVTCDDFLNAMADANDTDLEQFKLWYSQAGTPELTVATEYNAEAHTFTIKCKQSVPPTPGQPDKLPMLLPITVGLLGADGADMPATLKGMEQPGGTSTVLRMTEAEQEFVFVDVPERPVASLLRGFSAPVKLATDLSQEDLIFLLANDSDDFNRWDAAQTLLRDMQLRLLAARQAEEELVFDSNILEALGNVVADASKEDADLAFIACVLTFPGSAVLSELVPEVDPMAIYDVCKFVQTHFAASFKDELTAIMHANTEAEYGTEKASRAKRSLKNLCLSYLSSLEEPATAEEALARCQAADNMTDQVAALSALCSWDTPLAEVGLNEFYEQWSKDSLVLIKWFSLQAGRPTPGNLEKVKALLDHPDFKITNPNTCSALIGGFASSTPNFHAADGSGYDFLAEMVLKLDAINPQVAARLVSGLSRWRKYEPVRRELMKAQLERVAASEGLSPNVLEIASKSLA
ncbi:hypothetical protein CYMTET_48368 [Cymbomonas tetramitiformis]|uniref:Aminopeptidase N n=1 Tax=Cymbomonas tetramitiformis TaxID=36881 RepID=A0AAE0BU90_9CHLO|nr:hypothetical protein CYMTET_48368 [Cymbomonas tetramitiformis]